MPWRQVMLRDSRVWARCDGQGKLVVDDSRVEIRYRPNDGKAYRAAQRNLTIIQNAPVVPDGELGSAEPADVRRPQTGRATHKNSVAKRATVALPEPPAHALIAYTDGACSGNPGPCGIGVVLEDQGERREFSEYLGRGTNNIGELTAIARAVEAVESTSRPIWIFTDSRYAIGVLTEGWRAKANAELVAALKARLATLPQVRFVHVPGHAGIELNERADALARAAIRERATLGWADAHEVTD